MNIQIINLYSLAYVFKWFLPVNPFIVIPVSVTYLVHLA